MHKRIVIADLDGTISDYTHRIKYYKLRDYKKFNSEGINDKPIENICNIIRHLASEGVEIMIMTARDSSHSKATVKWLNLNDIPFSRLIMRPVGDESSDDECKRRLYNALPREEQESVWFVLEDRKIVVDMWRGEGLTCLQVAPGDL